MENKNKTGYVIAGVIVIALIILAVVYKRPATTPSTGGTITEQPATDTSGTGTSQTPPQTSTGTSSTASSTFIHTANIRLVSPTNGGFVSAGMKITAQFEATAPVASGKITFLGNDCPFEITNATVGMHTFTCDVPNTYIGTRQAVITERVVKAGTSAPVTLSASGIIRIAPPAGASPQSISYAPAGIIKVPMVNSGTRPYVDLSVVYSDGVTRRVSAADFKYAMGNTSIATVDTFFADSFAYITPKKLGTTNLTVTYNSLTKVIPVEVTK